MWIKTWNKDVVQYFKILNRISGRHTEKFAENSSKIIVRGIYTEDGDN